MFADRAAKICERREEKGGGRGRNPEANGVERERERESNGHEASSHRPTLIFTVYTANNCEAGLIDHRPWPSSVNCGSYTNLG